MSADEAREKHESYGLVQFSRCGGHPGRLFGSSLKEHDSFITLSIKTAELVRGDGRDRYYGSMRGDIAEVHLSAAQFAELLTTMNIGCGAPCTIYSVGGKRREAPPDVPTEVEHVRSSFAKDVRKQVADIPDVLSGIKATLSKKSILQSDRTAVIEACTSLFDMYSKVAPYVLDMFEEATEKVVQHAKAEVDACLQHVIVTAGITSLREKAKDALPLLPVEFEVDDG